MKYRIIKHAEFYYPMVKRHWYTNWEGISPSITLWSEMGEIKQYCKHKNLQDAKDTIVRFDNSGVVWEGTIDEI